MVYIDFTFCDLSQLYLLFNIFPIHTFVASSSELDNDGTLVGSTTGKLKDKLGLFFILYEKELQQGHFALRYQFLYFNFMVLSLTVKQ